MSAAGKYDSSPAGSVLVVAPPSDTHALAVAHVLETDYGIEALLWDTERVIEGISFDPGLRRLTIAANSGTLPLQDLRSVWWRRPRKYGLTQEGLKPDVLNFCEREHANLLLGALHVVDAPVINNPHAEVAAQRKGTQLAIARRVGLRVPPTVISNRPDQVIEFWEQNNRDCVYKTLTPTPGNFRETRLFTELEMCDLDSLPIAPVIIQKRLTGLDIRLTVIGDTQYAAVVRPNPALAAIDWRLDLTAEWKPYPLDTVTRGLVRSLLDELGLHYGCVDLRLDDQGNPYFLEVNPSGQFLFVEVDTGQPILEAMCSLLAEPTSLQR